MRALEVVGRRRPADALPCPQGEEPNNDEVDEVDDDCGRLWETAPPDNAAAVPDLAALDGDA